MLGQQLPVDTGAIVEPIDVGRGHELEQVLIARHVGGQQNQVMRAVIEPGLFLKQASARLIDLTAKDRLYACCLRGVMKSNRAVHLPMVGQGKRIHPQFPGAST